MHHSGATSFISNEILVEVILQLWAVPQVPLEANHTVVVMLYCRDYNHHLELPLVQSQNDYICLPEAVIGYYI